MRRPYGSLVVDTYVYLHNQRPERSITVRKHYNWGKRNAYSVYRSFSVKEYGSLSTAIWHAIRWRNLRFGNQRARSYRRVA